MSICLAIADADWSLTKDVFEVAGNVATIVGVLVASILGVLGFYSWRVQGRGQNSDNVARRMLVELYKFEMLFSEARVPGIYEHEVSREGDSGLFLGGDYKFLRLELGLERRIEKLNASFSEMSTILLEARVFWGSGVRELIKELDFLKVEYEEYARLRILCANPNELEDEKLNFKDDIASRRLVFKSEFGSQDEFGVELESAIRNMENELRLKLM